MPVFLRAIDLIERIADADSPDEVPLKLEFYNMYR